MKRIVSLKKTTLDAIRDSINDTDWDFLHELKKYKYDVITNAMPKVFGNKTLKRFKGKYNDYDFSYAAIANLLDVAEKEKLLKYLKSNELQKDSKVRDSEYIGNARTVTRLPKVGDKDELESESIWEEDSIFGETWIDTPELLEEDDFKDPSMREYWIEELTNIKNNSTLLSKQRIAMKLLSYLDDFKNRDVQNEIEGDLKYLLSDKAKKEFGSVKKKSL